MRDNTLGYSQEELRVAALPFLQEEEKKEKVLVPEEQAFNSLEVQELSKNSLDFLAGLAMPLVYQYAFPPVYLSVWNWLLTYTYKPRDFSQLALGLPRGFAKTMVAKLYILYCILFTRKKFILVVCETTDKAVNILADVIGMLNEPNIIRVFGDWKLGIENDTQKLKKFGFRGRDIILMGAGVESGIRGITIKNERPDIMLFDDIQSRACAESAVQSGVLEREFIGTAMKSKSPHGCLFIFIANMYPTKYSILRKLKTNPSWMKFIAGGILADGTSLWEDLQPIEQLLRELQNDISMGHPEIFFAEVLNDENASSNNLIDLSQLPIYPFQEDDIPGGNFIVIDPATDKANADAVSIGYFEVHNAFPVLQELHEGRYSPGKTISISLEIALRRNCRCIAIESNAYQSTLAYWFRFICQQRGIEGIEAVEIYSGRNSKVSRILGMLKSYMAAEIFIHPSITAIPHTQIQQFNPIKSENVDGVLDLLAYAPKVIELYGELITSMDIILNQDNASIPILPEGANTCF